MKCTRFAVLAAIPLLLVTACTKNRVSQGLMDDPQTHADRGKQYWDKGENQRAREEYQLALQLDKKFAPALAGMALVEAREKRWDKADDLAEQAIDKGEKIPDGWMAKGVVITEKNKGTKDEDWVNDAERAFRKAAEIAPRDGEVWYRMGNMRISAYKFREAGDAYRKVLDLNNAYTTPANDAWARVQKIERAAPGSRVGKRIALVDTLTRADAAALFIAELELDRLLARTRGEKVDTSFKAPEDARIVKAAATATAPANDLAGHWAANFIVDALKLGVRGLQVYPDGNFVPNQALTRAEFAFLAEDALIVALGDKSLATKHIGEASRFSDVAAGSPYSNAIANAVDKNVMDGEPDGSFGATKPVSGADALLTIRLIKELRK